MTLYSIYQIATDNNIKILNIPLKTSKAKVVKCYDQTCIAIDKQQINNATEEIQTLMTCLGHCFSNSLYSLEDTKSHIENCNSVAKEWVCNNFQ